MVRVKICGITSLSDALKAVEFGADALGFVLAQSPREIGLDQLRKICQSIPPFVDKIGVFVNKEIPFIKGLLDDKIIDYAQLHGDEGIEYCSLLPIKRVIKAIRPKNQSDVERTGCFKDVGAILIDSFVSRKRGGTGKVSDWKLALKTKKIGPPLILSGGLNVENIGEAIKTVKPYAVDVSSGIEKSPGIKDYRLLKAFIQEAKGP